MIHVIATIELRPETKQGFLAELHRVIPLVHAETGCIEYGPAVDVASGIMVQNPVRDNVVVIIEKWDSMETLKAHLQAPHMADYRAAVKEFVHSVQLQILEPA